MDVPRFALSDSHIDLRAINIVFFAHSPSAHLVKLMSMSSDARIGIEVRLCYIESLRRARRRLSCSCLEKSMLYARELSKRVRDARIYISIQMFFKTIYAHGLQGICIIMRIERGIVKKKRLFVR